MHKPVFIQPIESHLLATPSWFWALSLHGVLFVLIKETSVTLNFYATDQSVQQLTLFWKTWFAYVSSTCHQYTWYTFISFHKLDSGYFGNALRTLNGKENLILWCRLFRWRELISICLTNWLGLIETKVAVWAIMKPNMRRLLVVIKRWDTVNCISNQKASNCKWRLNLL